MRTYTITARELSIYATEFPYETCLSKVNLNLIFLKMFIIITKLISFRNRRLLFYLAKYDNSLGFAEIPNLELSRGEICVANLKAPLRMV